MLREVGADGGTRTRTAFRPQDFKFYGFRAAERECVFGQ
jgi:hypothetical protein